MNPYDFVPLDMNFPPKRSTPIWHHVLKSAGSAAGPLYSGHLSIAITTEMPLFIPDTDAFLKDPEKAGEHIFNNAGKYILPGSSLKGLLRSVVETLCSGCLKMVSLPVGYDERSIPPAFERCQDNRNLCMACRVFGMMPEGQSNAQVFLGKLNIGDALTRKGKFAYHRPIYTAVLEAPKPRHRAFYLDVNRRFIAGRKFYFHHYGELKEERRLIPIPNSPGSFRNQHIEPLDRGTVFDARIDFTNLEADEFAALLLAITLKPEMRHKIGYGKPIGLGSIRMELTGLSLVDYAARYAVSRASRTNRGISTYSHEQLTSMVRERMASFDERVHNAWQSFAERPALGQLQAIWNWQPHSGMSYSYPTRDWFSGHPQARIAETQNL